MYLTASCAAYKTKTRNRKTAELNAQIHRQWVVKTVRRPEGTDQSFVAAITHVRL